MVFALTRSKTQSLQTANTYLSQQFSGTCDVSCTNVMSNVNIDLINTNLSGGITISQSCATDANCLINSYSNAVADTLFKATNATTANNAGWFDIDSSTADSQQSIVSNIVQQTSESCDVSSLNVMDDVTVFAANSNLSGGIAFNQAGQANGSCSLQNTMTAAAYASGTADNTSYAGKKGGKVDKKQAKSSKLVTITYLVIGVVIVVGIIMIAKAIVGSFSKKDLSKQELAAIQAELKLDVQEEVHQY